MNALPPRAIHDAALLPCNDRHSQTRLLSGIALSAGIAALSLALENIGTLQRNGIGALTLAIVIGMLIGNTLYAKVAHAAAHGVSFSKQTLLRLGIILYGLRLTFQDIARVGVAGMAIDTLMLSTTFGLAWFAGTRIFGLDRRTAMLIGAGSSICGAAAVMATEPVVRGRAEQVAVAVATVVVFGTLAIFLYPALYALNQHWHFLRADATVFGLYTGATVHEVAQVVAAARAINIDAANTAVIVKMVRVMLLAPFLIALSIYLARDGRVSKQQKSGRKKTEQLENGQHNTDTFDNVKTRITIPWFALAFIAMAGVNSLHVIPHPVTATLIRFDTFLLAMAMAALGLTTHASALRQAGSKPLLLAALLFAWLVIGGALITRLVTTVI